MSVDLTPLRDCFEGIIPSIVATVALDGTPNISYLSHVHLVDAGHVALSNQFFSKTSANIAATGRATLMVVDGRTGAQHVLDLVHVAEHRTGDLFERMAAHLKAMSAQHGMAEIMALRSADVYRVESITPVQADDAAAMAVPRPSSGARLSALAALTGRLGGERDLDRMIDLALDGLDRGFGYRHTMLLIGSAEIGRLATLASHGYPARGVGSEIAFGTGVIGIAAAACRALRIGDMSRGRRYAAAVRSGLELEERAIPLPGLADAASQIAVPLLRAGEVQGVLFAESPQRLAFGVEDEEVLTIVAAQLAAALHAAALHAADDEREAMPQARPAPEAAPPAATIAVRHFAYDDSVFIDGDYLIKGVSGRLLVHMLRRFLETGQRDFANRELRLAPELRLPEVKDNLETRLILLRRRLDERGGPVRLSRPERGRLRLELDGRPELQAEAR